MNAYKRFPRTHGFGLLDLLVAVLVLGVAFLALANLQGTLLRGGGTAKARAIAAQLAQEKLDDLKSFEQLADASAENGVFSFPEIGDNAGGRELVDGSLELPNGNIALSGVTFALSWTATDHYYCGANSAPTTSATCGTTTLPYPDYKMVTLNVAWTDADGTAQTLQTQEAIHSADPALTTGTLVASNIDDDPLVPYNPGAAPDVIPVYVGDGKTKEVSVPEPDVSQSGEFTEITFDEVWYDNNTNTLERVAFVTVNCKCSQAGSGTGYTPTLQTDGGVILGRAVTKRVGAAVRQGQDAQQPEICDACCRDHHDVSGEDKYDPFRTDDNTHYPPSLGGDHGHFALDNNGDLVAANGNGDEYIEACRFRRVGGLWRLLQDWNLATVKVMPDTYLQVSDNVDSYIGFIEDYIEDYMSAISSPSTYAQNPPAPATAWGGEPDDVAMTADQRKQFHARGIYIDFMDAELITDIQSKISNNEEFLYLVPFHEVNLTSLSNWSADPDVGATVTNEPIADNNAHSRGIVRAIAGNPDITSNIERSNTGLTDTAPVDPNDGDVTYNKQDDVTLDIGGVVVVSGPMVRGSLAVGGGTGINISDIVITHGNGAVYCARDLVAETFECQLDAQGSGSITFSNYNAVRVNGAGTTVNDNTVCPATGSVSDDGQADETTVFEFSGAVDGATLDINVRNTGC